VTALYYALGVLFVVVGIAASIALHELGHMVPAKRFGVKVTQYMVGFGPTLWSRKRGETEYGIKWIPLGGYIRMIGMFAPKPGETQVRASSTGRLGLMLEQIMYSRAERASGERRPSLVEQARQQSQDEIEPGDEQRAFFRLSVPRKIIVMLGGPTMNLVIAVVLLTVVVTGFGLESLTTTLSSVSQCVLAEDAPAGATCAATDQRAPAAAAGLKPGDTIVSFDGQPVQSWEQLRTAIRDGSGREVVLSVRGADGGSRTVPVKPIVANRPQVDEQGAVIRGANGKPVTDRVGFLGVAPTSELRPQSVTKVPGLLADGLTRTAAVILRIPEKMVGVAKAAFGSGERDPNGPISVVGASRFAGEIASVDGGKEYGLRERMAGLISIVASLNLALFVFNLIPLLPLDGGHVAGAVWEGIRRRWSALRKRPDPGPVDVARLLPVAYAVSGFLLIMSVLLIYADIVRPVKLGG
jgi:membrane-associated protease RseP (regulator of RpoE activity)